MKKNKKIYYVYIPNLNQYFIVYSRNKLEKLIREIRSEGMSYYVKEYINNKN
jgi:hypothetical protein